MLLWSAIKGVLDVASLPFGRRRGHVLWSVADVVSFLGCAVPSFGLCDYLDREGFKLVD